MKRHREKTRRHCLHAENGGLEQVLPSEGTSPADTLIMNFQPPERRQRILVQMFVLQVPELSVPWLDMLTLSETLPCPALGMPRVGLGLMVSGQRGGVELLRALCPVWKKVSILPGPT